VGDEDRIDYAGPSSKFEPSLGGNRGSTETAFKTPAQRSYADIDRLDRMLAMLITQGQRFINVLEGELVNLAMPVTLGDERLAKAVETEWPSSLGTRKDNVSYRFYRWLVIRKTTSAAYIRQRFEEAMRDVTGTHSLDLLELVNVIVMEAKLVQQFRATYIGRVDDASEYRTVELFLDWADGAWLRLQQLSQVHGRVDVLGLPSGEVESTTPREAKNAQAMFKVKLNSTNRELTNLMSFIKRNYSDHAATFYSKFLGPALQFRLNASRGFHPSNGAIGQEMMVTANALDTNLSVVQADQMRRNMIFETKTAEAASQIVRQDLYRTYITQLSTVGAVITAGTAGTVMEVPEAADEVEYFESDDVKAQLSAAVLPTAASHGALADLTERDAHPQYLNRDGDIMMGNFALASGATIDGIVPSLHQHNGTDGSQKISGLNIEEGSVGPGVIDRKIVPPRPQGLRLASQRTRINPPGVTVVDAEVAWEGESTLSYEIQSVPLV
jgi:hypothetical protein